MRSFKNLEAIAAPLDRANVDTDQIVPALYLQKPRSDDFGAYLFRDIRHDAQGRPRPDFVLNNPAYAQARILVAGPNFGCGSSREHAVWALEDGGFRVVIAPSFGDIFHSNALKNGLLPVQLPAELVQEILAALLAEPGTRMLVDLETRIVTGPGKRSAAFSIDPFARHCLLEGLDEIDFTLTQRARIEAYEKREATT